VSDSGDHRDGHTRLTGRKPALLGEPIVQSIVFILVVSTLFFIFPGIDVWFSGLFYDPSTGFPLSRLDALKALRSIGKWLIIGAVVALVAAPLIKLARPRQPTPVPPRDILFLLSTLAIGPGLVVNLILKEYWGRPRPMMVEIFGGEAPFVTVWRMSDYCLTNCSFVSGEASAAIWLVALAVIAPPNWRRAAMKILFVLAVFLSLNRVAFGRHFLSDILLAWGLTLLVIAVMHRSIVKHPPDWLRNDRLEAWLTRFGMRLRSGPGPLP